jgi:hypothetical protein
MSEKYEDSFHLRNQTRQLQPQNLGVNIRYEGTVFTCAEAGVAHGHEKDSIKVYILQAMYTQWVLLGIPSTAIIHPQLF